MDIHFIKLYKKFNTIKIIGYSIIKQIFIKKVIILFQIKERCKLF